MAIWSKRFVMHFIFGFVLLNLSGSIRSNGLDTPLQCKKYKNLTDKNRNRNNALARIPRCDDGVKRTDWYRFSGQAGNTLTSKDVRKGMCGASAPGKLQGSHPCGLYETTQAQVCFVDVLGDCETLLNISVTFCGQFYVYRLPGIHNCSRLKRKYCGEDTEVPLSSCRITSRITNAPLCNTTSPVQFTRTNKSEPTEGENSEETFKNLEKEVDDLAAYMNKFNATERKQVAQEITNQLSNATDLDKLKTERKTGLKSSHLRTTCDILQNLVGLNISDVNIMEPVNNILDQRNTNSWKNISNTFALRNLVLTIENFGFQQGENLKNNPNASTTFTSKNSNVELHVNRVQPGNVSLHERIFNLPDVSIDLSPNALTQDLTQRSLIVVAWYKTMHSFVQNSSSGENGVADVEIKNNIVTASVRPKPDPEVKFSQPVRISWNMTDWIDTRTCVYWKPELNNHNYWRTDGCKRDKTVSDRLICECDHLTAFACMDISGNMADGLDRKALELISTIGCSVSLAGVLLTIFTHAFLWKRLRQNAKSRVPSQVLMHLCVAIGMTDIFAVLAGPAHGHEVFCTAVSISLYFSVLACFGWMLCEGVLIYLQLVNVFTGMGLGGKHLRVFYIVGWGVPAAAVTLLTSLVGPDEFITSNSCWCQAYGVLFWTFAGTICVIWLINIVVFILALRSALSSSDMSTNRSLKTGKSCNAGVTKSTAGLTSKRAKVALKGFAVLLPLLGLTWVFGLLVLNRNLIAFKYLFAIFNSLQGLMIFVFHILLNKKIHDAIQKTRKVQKHKLITIKSNNKGGTPSTYDSSPRKSSMSSMLPQGFSEGNSPTIENNYAFELSKKSLKPVMDHSNSTSNIIVLENLGVPMSGMS